MGWTYGAYHIGSIHARTSVDPSSNLAARKIESKQKFVAALVELNGHPEHLIFLASEGSCLLNSWANAAAKIWVFI